MQLTIDIYFGRKCILILLIKVSRKNNLLVYFKCFFPQKNAVRLAKYLEHHGKHFLLGLAYIRKYVFSIIARVSQCRAVVPNVGRTSHRRDNLTFQGDDSKFLTHPFAISFLYLFWEKKCQRLKINGIQAIRQYTPSNLYDFVFRFLKKKCTETNLELHTSLTSILGVVRVILIILNNNNYIKMALAWYSTPGLFL